jgi:P-type E1-E2 ATPase
MREEEVLVLSVILQDTIKTDSKEIIQRLSKEGMDISIYTGDNAESAQKVADQIAP